MSAIVTPEVELPTLSLDPSQLVPVSQLPPVTNHTILTITDPVTGVPIGLSMAPEPLKPAQPYLRILEQPKTNALRFRYQCEGRGAGALQGEKSTAERKSYPRVQICNYKGPAVVVVSCVTHDNDPSPRAHPHNLVSPASVGKGGCKMGVCKEYVNSEDMTIEFPHLGIQCVRKKDVETSLRERRSIRVDPYRQGFRHMDTTSTIDLNAVKLCFQAFLEAPDNPGKYTTVLDPVCSVPVFDAKAKKELVILDISETEAPAEGGKKIIILCEKVLREDIKVRFWDPTSGWEGWGQFSAQGVHKQVAISLVTPAYPRPGLTSLTRHRVRLELVRPSDEACSEPLDFTFTAATAGPSSAVGRAADKENTGILVNISSDNPENNPNVKLELNPMMPKDYQDLLCNNPMDLRDSGSIGENLTAFEHVMNNLSGKIESLSFFNFSDVIADTENPSDDTSFDPLVEAGSEPRRGSIKRSSVSAALETGSGHLRPKLSLHTPDHSDSLLSDHQIQMTRLLTN